MLKFSVWFSGTISGCGRFLRVAEMLGIRCNQLAFARQQKHYRRLFGCSCFGCCVFSNGVSCKYCGACFAHFRRHDISGSASPIHPDSVSAGNSLVFEHSVPAVVNNCDSSSIWLRAMQLKIKQNRKLYQKIHMKWKMSFTKQFKSHTKIKFCIYPGSQGSIIKPSSKLFSTIDIT